MADDIAAQVICVQETLLDHVRVQFACGNAVEPAIVLMTQADQDNQGGYQVSFLNVPELKNRSKRVAICSAVFHAMMQKSFVTLVGFIDQVGPMTLGMLIYGKDDVGRRIEARIVETPQGRRVGQVKACYIL